MGQTRAVIAAMGGWWAPALLSRSQGALAFVGCRHSSIHPWELRHSANSICTTRPLHKRQRNRLAAAPAATAEPNGRSNLDGVSLDPQFVAKNPELVIGHLKARRAADESVVAVHEIAELMRSRSELIKSKDAALNTRKTLSAQIGKLMKDGKAEEAGALKEQVEEANRSADGDDVKLKEADDAISQRFLRLPNLLDSRVVDGDDDTQNELVSQWGDEHVKQGEGYLWHDDIASRLGGWDPEAAARISGARFSVLKGPLARLERALSNWLLDLHTQENGYTEVQVPLVVTRSALEGTGQLPKFEDDLFKTNHQAAGEDSFLIPTAEVPLTNLVRGQLLDLGQLPMSFVSLTPCFRAEAGSHGRDTRGLLRQHQFSKVELVKITTPSDSAEQHELLTGHAEGVLKALKLPYRKMRLCSGDIGFGARMCYDLEVWLPGQQAYREISSCSNCADFQARRMGVRYREPQAKAKKPLTVLCHTINGSGVAVGRALVAVLENYYNPDDGSVTVPEVLRPYMGGLEKLTPPGTAGS